LIRYYTNPPAVRAVPRHFASGLVSAVDCRWTRNYHIALVLQPIPVPIRYLPPILPPNDLLSMVRAPAPFLMDLLECPGLIKQNLQAMTAAHLEMHQTLAAIRAKYQEGNLHHYPIWCSDYVGLWQSDVSAMISPDMYEEFIVPELEQASTVYEKIIYHLDGPDAIRHVDSACAVDKVHLIQWEPGAGNPHGAHWLDLYKRIQANGKAVLIYAPHADLEILIKELDPAKTVLRLGARNLDDGNALLQRITELTKRHHGTATKQR